MPSDSSGAPPQAADGADGDGRQPVLPPVGPTLRYTDGRVDGVPAWAVVEIERLQARLADAEEQHDRLHAGLQSNRRIGMAVGILMALRQVTADEAFDLLRRASQTRNTKLREIAEVVIRTGTVD